MRMLPKCKETLLEWKDTGTLLPLFLIFTSLLHTPIPAVYSPLLFSGVQKLTSVRENYLASHLLPSSFPLAYWRNQTENEEQRSQDANLYSHPWTLSCVQLHLPPHSQSPHWVPETQVPLLIPLVQGKVLSLSLLLAAPECQAIIK